MKFDRDSMADLVRRGHLAGGIARIDDEALSNADKRRFLIAVGDDYWVARSHSAVLARIKTEVAQEEISTSTGTSTEADETAQS